MTKKDNETKDHAGQVNTRKPAGQGQEDDKPQHKGKPGGGFRTKMSNAAARLTIYLGVLLVAPVCIAAMISFFDKNQAYSETGICQDTARGCPPDLIFKVNGLEYRMIGIKGGHIHMKGATKTTKIKDFFIGETEVTQELWMAVMGSNPSSHRGDLNMPVDGVDMEDCLHFAEKLSKMSGRKLSVPTYAYWLYAAKAGEEPLASNCHTDSTLTERAWYRDNSLGITHAVKSRKPNSLGIYDMTGNLQEWTSTSDGQLFRTAGSSYNSKPEHCHLDHHDDCNPESGKNTLGLRLIYIP